MNGVDNLSYLNINTATVTPYTQLATPSAPTLTTNGVGAGAFNLYYRITANSSVGETAASNALALTIDTDRDLWNGTTDYIKIEWSAVTDAVSYNVYLGVVSGQEYRIATDVNALEYTDSGSAAIDYRNPFPTSDSTAGPKTTRGAVINGRPWMVGDAESPYSVWRGGDPGYELDFSPAHGGGSQFVGYGTKDIPVNVKSFRDGQGKSSITVLCQGTNGNGKRFLLTPDTYTYGSSVYSFWSVTEDNGQDGTDSPDAIITYGDDLHYPSRDGFKTTGTQPQLQNILSTRRTSNTIQDDLKLLTSSAMGGAVGLGFEGRLYFSLPVSSDHNTELWVLDLDRKGAWMKPWSIGADWMWLYNDNSGVTHFCLLVNNEIVEFSYSQLTQDNGVPFSTLGASGEIYFSDDKRMWVQLLQVVIVLLKPQGTMSFQITGKTEDDAFAALGNPYTFIPVEFTAETQTTIEGWGEANEGVTGWGQEPWSGTGDVNNTTTLATQEVIIPVDEEVQWASYSWSTKGAGVDYSVSDVIFEYIETGIKDLS
jgi:hypothetical protein